MAAPAGSALLGTFDAWEAYKGSDNGRGSVCYVVSQPQSKEPKGVNRDPVYFLITSWPSQKVVNEPSIIIGYPFKERSEVTVQVGSDKFQFFTKDDGAWLASRDDETKLIAAMRAAGDMTVKGMSKRGTLTTDGYSLKGISQALDKATEGCK
ncbi:MAG: hypothetical protein GC190_08275 [Alphaproteobacteria bacterium]|nr:hypothetical protein [Alphaproteobacteria bacterium]